MSTWSQLRNMDSYGTGLGMDNAPVSGLSPLIDFSSMSSYGTPGLVDVSQLAMPAVTMGGNTAAPTWVDSLKGLFSNFSGTPASPGNPGSTGWGMPVVSALSGLMNGYMGMKNYGLAKDQFNFTKDMANKNLQNQTKMVNGQLEDRQRARVAANPSAYQSVDAYMKEKGLNNG